MGEVVRICFHEKKEGNTDRCPRCKLTMLKNAMMDRRRRAFEKREKKSLNWVYWQLTYGRPRPKE